MWISAAFVCIGLALAVLAVAMTLMSAVRAASVETWRSQWLTSSYVTFAWQELGRGVFFGYLFMLGLVPLTAFFFLGQSDFWSNFLFFSALIWAAAAITSYFVMVLPGIIGYGRRRRSEIKGRDWSFLGQVVLVLALSAPFGYALKTFLLPPTDQVLNILVATFKLYTRVLA